MFDFLQDIDKKLYKRYLTIETNIKAKSNSFYDSWLELVEGFSKLVAKKEGIEVTATYDTFLGVLKEKEYQKYVKSLGLTSDNIDELFTLGKEANGHKHDEENNISLVEILRYLKSAFKYIGSYWSVEYKETMPIFHESHYVGLYGQTEKEIEALKVEKKKLQESLLNSQSNKEILESDLKRVKEIASRKQKESESLEEEKETLLEELNELKNIKLTTMEEKVSKILTVLEKQTATLSLVSDQLDYASYLNFGKPSERPAGGICAGSEWRPKMTGFEAYRLRKIFYKEREEKLLNYLKSIDGGEITMPGREGILSIIVSNIKGGFAFCIKGAKRRFNSYEYDKYEENQEHTYEDVVFTAKHELDNSSDRKTLYHGALKILLEKAGMPQFNLESHQLDEELIKLYKEGR